MQSLRPAKISVTILMSLKRSTERKKFMSSDLPLPSVHTPFLRRFTDEAARDLRETVALYRQVRDVHTQSAWAQSDVVERINAQCAEVVGKVVTLPSHSPFLEA